METNLILSLVNEQATLDFGAILAQACATSSQQTVINLFGDLGMGKTTLVRGLLKELGHQGPVKSPTYNLLEQYTLADKQIYHFDLYRLADPEELYYIGIRDYLSPAAIFLVEWPQRGEGMLPKPDIDCYIDIPDVEKSVQQRVLNLTAYSDNGRDLLHRLK